MIKNKLPNGLIYYKTTTTEIRSIGGRCICDECGKFQPDGGFLVPVLNHWQCKSCFDDWKSCCRHYPEDDDYEEVVCRMYEKRIPCTTLI